MKKYLVFSVIAFFLVITIFAIFNGKRIKLLFNSDVVIINNVNIFDSPVDINSVSESDAPQRLFVEYFTVAEVGAYNRLFLDNESPNLSAVEFDTWHKYLAQGSLKVLGVIYLTINANEYCLIQYVLEFEKHKSISGFLAKKRSNKWNPCSKLDLIRYHEIKKTFEQHRLDGLVKCLVNTRHLKENDLRFIKGRKKKFFVVRSLDGIEYMDFLLKALESKSDDARKFARSILYPAMQIRKKGLAEDSDLENKKTIYIEYLREISYPRNKEGILMEMIDDGNYLGVAMAVKKYAGYSSVHNCVLKVREVFGEDKIYMSR